jgi:beta-glucosidase
VGRAGHVRLVRHEVAGPAANGGLDLVMPGPRGPWGDALVAAVASGEVSRRSWTTTCAGCCGWPTGWAPWATRLPHRHPRRADRLPRRQPGRREQLTRLAATGMTVLTNDGVLPLAPTPGSR